jgi:hypothetical protein
LTELGTLIARVGVNATGDGAVVMGEVGGLTAKKDFPKSLGLLVMSQYGG